MIVKIENGRLGQAIDLLFNLSLKGKQSRHRTKFIKLLAQRLKEVEEQRIELAKEHAEKNEKGEPKVSDDQFEIKDKQAFAKDIKELYEEELIIEGGNHQDTLNTVKEILLNCEEEFSGQQADVFDYLCEQFEKGGDE